MKFGLVLGVIAVSSLVHGQIEIKSTPEKTDEKDVMELEPEKKPKESTTEVYGFMNWSATNRKLVENTSGNGLFADTLGERANEIGLNVWSFGLGLRSEIKGNWMWQGGITFMRNGESYLYEDVDTSFSYQTYYNYIAMPLKVVYAYGDKFKVYGGAGIVPQMFFSYRQEQQWTTTKNVTGSETIKTRNGYNTFVMSFAASIGFQMRVQNNVSLFVEPEYRYQFINSYTKTDGLQHFGRAIGLNLGFTYKL